MTAALNAWKQAGFNMVQVPEKIRPEQHTNVIENFEIVAARRLIATVIGTLEEITPLFKEYCPIDAERKWCFHGDQAKNANVKDMPNGYTAVVLNDVEWEELKRKVVGLAYLLKIKPHLAACANEPETKPTHEKIVQGVLAVFKNANKFHLDSIESKLKFFDSIFTDPKNKGTNRNHLLLALSYAMLNAHIKKFRELDLKIENEKAAWEWDQKKIIAIAP